MRIAVALPSLEAGAVERVSIDAMLAHLAAAGHDLEGFAEHDRSDESAAFPVYHYLRMPERHTALPFDTALYPLGRDATPYQSVYGLMKLFPGAVWFLDPTVHHLAVGGIALIDDWTAYRELLDDAYGASGPAVAQTVATNWGTGALFRRYDLVAATAAGQGAVLAAWPALAARISSRLPGRQVSVVPLGMVQAQDGAAAVTAGSGGGKRIAIMSVNDSYATTAVRAAAAALDVDAGVRVRICLSEPIYKADGLEVARHMGIEAAIEWELTTSPDDLAMVASDSDVLLWLAEELQGGHRLLMLQGMAAGKVTFVPEASLYADLPEGAVVKLALGRTLGPTFGAIFREILEDPALRDGLADNARAFAAEGAGTEEAAQLLAAELEKLAATRRLEKTPVSAPAWDAVARRMSAAAMPGGASTDVESLVAAVLDACTEPFRT